jgi:hypothetical protein
MSQPTRLCHYLKMPFKRMGRRVVAANITTRFIGCVRRMPGFASL